MCHPIRAVVALSAVVLVSFTLPLLAQTDGGLLQGKAAFGDWRSDKPGTRRLIKPQDLPARRRPRTTSSGSCAGPIKSPSSPMASR